jgi:undecaprenyl-diphosphatase
MEIIQSAFIGIVQGIAEFLPISSSAHLVLVPYIFNWQYNGLVFDIALHMGTTAAILAFFWKDWIKIIKAAFARGKSEKADYPPNLLWQIVIATIPAGLAGVFLEDKVETYLHSPLLLAFNLAFFGILLWYVDKKAPDKLPTQDISYKKSFTVGLAQALSLIPGVSRSGITMIAARSIGFSRERAARFSFLLSTPATVGAFLVSLRKMDQITLDVAFVVGVAMSAIAGLLAIKFLLDYLKKSDFSVFMWYRIALAILIVGLLLYR